MSTVQHDEVAAQPIAPHKDVSEAKATLAAQEQQFTSAPVPPYHEPPSTGENAVLPQQVLTLPPGTQLPGYQFPVQQQQLPISSVQNHQLYTIDANGQMVPVSTTVPVHQPSTTYNSLPPVEQKQQQVAPVQPVPTQLIVPAAVDPAIMQDAVRSSFTHYITIKLDSPVQASSLPKELAARGLQGAAYAKIVNKVRSIKSTSNTNKGLVWTGMIFLLGIIGYLLVANHAVGNTPLRKQLAPVLEDENKDLYDKGINVRFVWHDGILRAYYK